MKVRLALVLVSAAALVACARAAPQAGPAPGGGRSGTSAAASPAPDPAAGVCPTDTALDPGPDAASRATAAATAAVPQRYASIDTTGFQVSKAQPADPESGYGAIAYTLCGPAVGQKTWVVELSFPKMLPSADLSAGQLFLSRFADGWRVWFQYH